MSHAWRLERGATVEGDGVRFSVWAPKAERASVVLYDGGKEREEPLDLAEPGVFETKVEGIGAGARYRFRLDGGDPLPDPVSRFQPEGVHGPSAVVDPDAFAWSDDGWHGLEMSDYLIYELHIGTFTEGGTFESAIERLASLRELGVTVIEIMPVAEFPGSRNWGYDGVDLYAPHHAYGGPGGLRKLVDAAHALGLGVVLDVVYNHVGPEGNYLGSYGPYFTETYKTPWGPAVNYDGADSPEVRRFVIENALYWITEYHIDGLRLDAVHGIFDFGAHHLLRELTEAVHAQGEALGRAVQVIAESDLNDPRLIRPHSKGGYGMDAQWSDDFHHAVHASLTGEREGYYSDFGRIEQIATALRDRFVYAGAYSRHRRRRHGAPATDVRADRFVICIQNHDQVGNRAAGERLSTLLSFEQLKVAASLYLLSPYVPMLFMGEEWGESNPFQYFVSHGDEELVDAVREGRRREFEAFGWGDDVPDPQDEETFRRSRLDWSRPEQSPHRELRTLYRDLLGLRARERALRPGDSRVRVASDEEARWIALELVPAYSDAMLALFNLGGTPRDIPLGWSATATWTVVLSTEDPRYCLHDERRSSPFAPQERRVQERRRAPTHGEVTARKVTVPACSAVLFRRETI